MIKVGVYIASKQQGHAFAKVSGCCRMETIATLFRSIAIRGRCVLFGCH